MNEWIEISDELPPDGLIVLATYVNGCGKQRIIRAQWVAQFTVDADPDLDEIGEYNEADEDDETTYLPEGWWERCDSNLDYAMFLVTEGDVTHWMRMPQPPVLRLS